MVWISSEDKGILNTVLLFRPSQMEIFEQIKQNATYLSCFELPKVVCIESMEFQTSGAFLLLLCSLPLFLI